MMSVDRIFAGEFSAEDARARPLCVALDGALIATDPFGERIMRLFRQRPWLLLVFPLWLFSGLTRFKQRVAKAAPLSVENLAYDHDLLSALRACHARGRTVVLVPGADATLSSQVAKHLQLFSAELPTQGVSNAEMKLRAVRESYGEDFDYVTHSASDVPLLAAAKRGFLVRTGERARRETARLQQVTILSARPSLLRALVKELRPHQWAKNALIILPLLLAPTPLSVRSIAACAVAVLAFSLCASAGYVFNDLLDLDADRAHASKRRRPFASGALPVAWGPPLFVGLLAFSLSAALTLSPAFLGMLVVYFVGTVSYSLYLKRLLLLDVLVLAGLYTHRVLAGGIAANVQVSAWLLGFSMFLFTNLAFAKRYIELRTTEHGTIKNRGYSRADLEMVTSFGTGSSYIAALVFMLYTESAAVRLSYREPVLLWLVLPVLLYWLGRIWLLAGRGLVQDDPVKFALKDRVSILCGALIAAIVALARFTPSWVSGILR